ncbi:hypothetical protein [Brevibacillus laterosporus]|uniref:Uncharacterized protein n=1 Tax=Brevibacillus laterosporus LMG 15441 TaxID=1042163 RepID=A0A075R4G6_BRELA|nr:hypothetical protein [Brevibacillus laterosporus]AIG27437.1 hypothetical protein BRLA_c031250 [Brevibacillus laterosporus LMG 15441]
MIELNLIPKDGLVQILSFAMEYRWQLFLIVGAIIGYKKFQGA